MTCIECEKNQAEKDDERCYECNERYFKNILLSRWF